MSHSFSRFAALSALLLLSVVVPAMRAADDMGTVKSRMEQRLPLLDQLKAKGVIGENNRGMLELRGGDVDAGDAVAAENRDRGIAYAQIAKQTGTSVEQVSRARARQIAAASAKGVWIQRDNGDWVQK